MKTVVSKITLGLAVGVALALGTVESQAFRLDFSNLDGATVRFVGATDTFSFTPSGGADQFEFTDFEDAVGDSFGLKGNMSGSFTIGSITSGPGGLETASVSGSGILTIHDGLGKDLTATLVWKDISTLGTGGAINVNGSINLSTIAYTGTRSDLLALKASGAGIETVTFQFTPALSLTDLTADRADNQTSFSGSITTSVPDGGATLVFLGAGLLGLGLMRYRFARLAVR